MMAEEEMSEEEMPMEDEAMMEEAIAIEEEMEGDDFSEEGMEEGSLDHEAIKDVIFESLQNFKQNREYLDGISQENPELYDSLIFCLQAMIEMAKEFGYGEVEEDMMGEEEMPMEDEEMMAEDDEAMMAEDDEAMMEEEMGEEMPMEEGEEEDDMNPEDFAVDEEEEFEEDDEEEEEDIEKNESFSRLMFKMHRISEMFSELNKADEEDVQQLKEEVKKKMSKKPTKKSSKKRKPSVKKPTVPGKKKKPAGKSSNDSSFCAKSHTKMRASGKDCRANEDKNSPLCSARKKFNCRGKNEEKKGGMGKSEKPLKKWDTWVKGTSMPKDTGFKGSGSTPAPKDKPVKAGGSSKTGLFGRKAKSPGAKEWQGVGSTGDVKSNTDKLLGTNKSEDDVKGEKQAVSEMKEASKKKDVGRYSRAFQNIKRANVDGQDRRKKAGEKKDRKVKTGTKQVKENKEDSENRSQPRERKLESSEKLSSFLKKKDKNLEKAGLPTEETTKKTRKPQHVLGTQKGTKIKVENKQTGETEFQDFSNGIAGKSPDGGMSPVDGRSNRAAPPAQKTPKG
jgi:hypothetical protein